MSRLRSVLISWGASAYAIAPAASESQHHDDFSRPHSFNAATSASSPPYLFGTPLASRSNRLLNGALWPSDSQAASVARGNDTSCGLAKPSLDNNYLFGANFRRTNCFEGLVLSMMAREELSILIKGLFRQ
ncbi:hypothetical protein Aduo_001446 [Ancylostoma duodenale]